MKCNDCIHFEVCGIQKVLTVVKECPYKSTKTCGEWIIKENEDLKTYICPFCGEHYAFKLNFCGNCGVDMRGAEND